MLESLTAEECRRLLATLSVGRLAVVRGGFPLVFPVNFAVQCERIIVHTDTGTKFSAARQRRVCFEADSMDAEERTGWSVLVQGFAVEVTPADDAVYEKISAVPVEPWAPGVRNRILVITPITITGRRISRGGSGRSRVST